ncbi:hypothetical protein [Ectobacillus panaciterrae]|uniref:hypothetical protein n=1 Tax=Ectobacillus panaciterrae TaxID=363872 RepID=UPI000420F853|nr:hypothetical protein [Ectobacillus panaciterrae]
MRKIFVFLCLLLMVPFSHASAEASGNTVCPKTQLLQEPSNQDKEELNAALSHYLISKVYGRNPKYLDYRLEVITPMKELKGTDKSYYYMAIQNCGREVANRSWFVRLRFPKMHNAASFGEIFVVKDQTNQWSVWFRYH